MADFAIRWNNFRGGDYGLRDPARADDNTFSGRNVAVYQSGLIGPRGGWKPYPVSGLPVHPTANGPMGFDIAENRAVITLGRNYDFPVAQPATATSFATYPASAATPVDFVRGNGVLYSLLNGVLYKHQAYGTAAITTPVPLSMVTRWGAFLVGVDRNVPWRLWFSFVDASGPDFDSWPINNYLDIGNTDPIRTLLPVFNTLFVGKPAGWWAVSGVLGELASVREVVVGNGPIDHRLATPTTDNRIMYWPNEPVPAWFNGERVYLDDDFTINPRALPFTGHAVITTPTARKLILCGDDNTADESTDMLIWQDSAWTRHRTPFNLGAVAPSSVKAAALMPEGVVFGVKRPATVGEAVQVLTWHHDLNRPAHVSDEYAAPIDFNDTDLVSGSMALPAWFDGQGRQVRVRSIIVQFRKWASGVPMSLNQIRMTVDALGPYEGGLITVDPEGWVEQSDRADTGDGTPDSWRCGVGHQGWANGFQIRFVALRGVAIQEVVALVDIRKERT